MMAYELGPLVLEPDTMVRMNVVCAHCGNTYDIEVREHLEPSTVEWTWACPAEGCGMENWEESSRDLLGFEG